MAFAARHSVAYSPEEQYDLMNPEAEPPEYPCGLCFTISEDDMEEIGGGSAPEIGETMHFAAMADVTSVFLRPNGCRIELQIGMLAGEDGKFCELDQPAYICFTEMELDKVGLEPDCERGDMIHLVGTLRYEGYSSTEYGGEMCKLQIIELSYVEDESDESRDSYDSEYSSR